MKNLNVLFFVRLLIGGLYVFSGTEKLLSSPADFIYVIHGYELVRDPVLVKIAALVIPWMELILGVFLTLGLWIRLALLGIGAYSTIFILVVGQALIRALPISECGCFGSVVTIPLPAILILDVVVLAAVVILFIKLPQTSLLSLDKTFSRRQAPV